MHLTASPADWYAARAAGIAAYVVLTLVVALGIAMAGKSATKRWPKFALEDVHRFGGLLVGAFVALHVLTIAVDSYLPFSVGQLVVPFGSAYRPFWTGLGIVSAELLLALAIANRYRRSLSYRFWRRTHYLNFVVWGAATLHGLGSGTDRNAPWLLALYALSTAVVAALVLRRALRPSRRVVLGGAAAGAFAVLAVGAVPLQPHPRPWNAAAFKDVLTGRIVADHGFSHEIISMAGNGSGTQNVLVRADLLVGPEELESTSLQVEYLPSGAVCKGKVEHVASIGFTGTCSTPSGVRRRITAAWTLHTGDTLTGYVESRPQA